MQKGVIVVATMKDVAREAGVALGTVSRYVNGESVKDSNREAIENAIKKLGYVQKNVLETVNENMHFVLYVK